MEADDTSSTLDEGFKCALRAIAHVAVVSFIDDKHVHTLKFFSAGVMQRTIDDCAVLGEDLAPVREKLRIVMLANLVSLKPRLEVYMHPVGVLAPGPRCALLSGRRLLR